MSGAREGAIGAWLRDRVGWGAITASLSAHRAPRRSFVFYLGGFTLFLLAVQLTSGALLALAYRPDAARAFESVERITSDVPSGDLVRAVHAWAGDLFVASLLAHAFTVVIRRSFRPPHELTWMSGVAALFVGLAIAFTGAILPWSELALTHARVGSALAESVPFVGPWLARVLRGGDEVTGATLGRAFGFHATALPMALAALVAAHLFFLSRKPARVAENDDAAATIALFPDFAVRQAAALTGVLVVVMSLAIFVPRPLGVAADAALATPPGARPPWYLLPAHQIVRLAPRELFGIDGPRFLVGAACVVALLAAALPFLDPRGAKVTAWIAWGVLITLVLLGLGGLA